MDTLWAPVYDERWGATIDPTHRSFVERVLQRCPPGAHILDAACGTGKYTPWSTCSPRTGLAYSQTSAEPSGAAFCISPSNCPRSISRQLSVQPGPTDYRSSMESGGYHYYPAIEQVRAWTDLAGFRVVDDGIGDDYHHFLCD